MKKRSGFFFLMLLAIMGLTFCVKEDPTTTLEELPISISVTFPPVKSAQDSIPDLTYSSLSDINGNIYTTVQIGTQTWMAENLRTTRYNDGNPITPGTGGPAGYTDWFDYGNANYPYYNGAYCWYENDASKYKHAYGAIYNWHAIGTGKLCPTGWHVPTISDWITLISSLGGHVEAFSERTENAMIHCSEKSINESGFAPITHGELCGWGFLESDFWWSATPRPTELAVPYAYLMSFNIYGYEPKSYGYSVRCLKD